MKTHQFLFSLLLSTTMWFASSAQDTAFVYVSVDECKYCHLYNHGLEERLNERGFVLVFETNALNKAEFKHKTKIKLKQATVRYNKAKGAHLFSVKTQVATTQTSEYNTFNQLIDAHFVLQKEFVLARAKAYKLNGAEYLIANDGNKYVSHADTFLLADAQLADRKRLHLITDSIYKHLNAERLLPILDQVNMPRHNIENISVLPFAAFLRVNVPEPNAADGVSINPYYFLLTEYKGRLTPYRVELFRHENNTFAPDLWRRFFVKNDTLHSALNKYNTNNEEMSSYYAKQNYVFSSFQLVHNKAVPVFVDTTWAYSMDAIAPDGGYQYRCSQIVDLFSHTQYRNCFSPTAHFIVDKNDVKFEIPEGWGVLTVYNGHVVVIKRDENPKTLALKVIDLTHNVVVNDVVYAHFEETPAVLTVVNQDDKTLGYRLHYNTTEGLYISSTVVLVD